MTLRRPSFSHRNEESFNRVVEAIRKNTNRTLSEPEAQEAARNLVGFCRTMLAIHAELNQNQEHDKRD